MNLLDGILYKFSVFELTLSDQLEDHIIFFLGFHRNQVHTVFSADISTVQPIDFSICKFWNVSSEEIVVTPEEELFRSWKKVKDKFSK